MRVLVVEPMEAPYVSEIGSSLEDLQNAVGGWIETVYPFDDDAAVICNEEGKLNGLDLNRAMRSGDGTILDVIAGTFLVAGLKGDGFASLSQEQIETYAALYSNPEVFLMHRGKVKAIPVSPIRSRPIVKNVYEETVGSLRLEVRRDDDPVDPRTLGEKLGTMTLFDDRTTGDAHSYPNPDVFLLDRLTEHFGSVKKAETWLTELDRSLRLPEGSARTEAERENRILREIASDHVIFPVFRSSRDGGVSAAPSVSWEGSRQAGWVWTGKQEVTERFGDFSPSSVQKAKDALEDEVSVYGDYLRGENYVYNLVDENTGKITDGGYWTGNIEQLRAFAINSLPARDQTRERSPER